MLDPWNRGKVESLDFERGGIGEWDTASGGESASDPYPNN